MALEKAKEEKLKKEHPFMHLFMKSDTGGFFKEHKEEEEK